MLALLGVGLVLLSIWMGADIRRQVASVFKESSLMVVVWPGGQTRKLSNPEGPPEKQEEVIQKSPQHFSQAEAGAGVKYRISPNDDWIDVTPQTGSITAESGAVSVYYRNFLFKALHRHGWLAGLLLIATSLILHNKAQSEPSATPPGFIPESVEEGGRIGPYYLEGLLGSGATGTVWSSRGPRGPVAVKVINPELLTDENFALRTNREFEIAQKLDHPAILKVRKMQEALGTKYFVMDRIEGSTLREHLAKRPLSLGEVVAYARVLASALQHAHGAGVIHRDLKPANVLLDQAGDLTIADFGLARASDSKTITVAGSFLGTPLYLAPDAAKGEKPTSAVDIYSLGVMLFEMCAGSPPFNGETPMQVMVAHLSAPIPPLPEQTPSSLACLITDMLQKEPGDRPTATEVLRRLDEISADD